MKIERLEYLIRTFQACEKAMIAEANKVFHVGAIVMCDVPGGRRKCVEVIQQAEYRAAYKVLNRQTGKEYWREIWHFVPFFEEDGNKP